MKYHDDLHGCHVLQGALGAGNLLHHEQPLGHRRAVAPSQGHPRHRSGRSRKSRVERERLRSPRIGDSSNGDRERAVEAQTPRATATRTSRPGPLAQFWSRILEEARKDPTYRKVVEDRDGDNEPRTGSRPRARARPAQTQAAPALSVGRRAAATEPPCIQPRTQIACDNAARHSIPAIPSRHMASPPGPAARSIVRLSGPKAFPIALAGFSPSSSARPSAQRRAAQHPIAGCLKVTGLRPLLPVMLALWPGPRSYTGQDVAEIHLIGSVPLVSLVLSHCFTQGARPAEPGEFTLRAFLSGRIDLTRAEAVLGVIEAQNPAQLGRGPASSSPAVSPTRSPRLRDRLLDLVAHLEANLDFTEEPDVDPLSRAAWPTSSTTPQRTLSRHCPATLRTRAGSRSCRASFWSDRPTPARAGSSTLFWAAIEPLSRRRPAPPATTSPRLCDCDGLSVELVDTAGFDEPADSVSIQRPGPARRPGRQRRSLARVPLGRADPLASSSQLAPGVDRIHVWTKADLALPDAAMQPRKQAMAITSAVDRCRRGGTCGRRSRESSGAAKPARKLFRPRALDAAAA